VNSTANLDHKEVEKFSAISTQWWDLDGPCAPLHILNPARLKFIQQHAKLENKTVLDVGCGAGILSESLAQHGAAVVGIDASNELIVAARAHAEQSKLNINYAAITLEDYLAIEDRKFDVITCMELIEHVPDPIKLINDCAYALKPGGKLFISTLNRTAKAYAFAIFAAELVLKVLPKNTHDYKKFIQPAEMAEMLRNANMRLTNLQGVKYQHFTKSAKLHDDLSVNYMACAIKEEN
jgi:2-polyprenyl-6-hydroxyphenyl methylase/3-demethylubiquinone-9 3-methyltransferase